MTSERAVLTVSALTAQLRAVLEERFPAVWVEGEISNYRLYGSGHAYFTLKDADAQLRCALFRTRGRRLRFEPADGLHVMAFGSVEVYAQRGEYQLVVELLEPKGLGALQLAFEQLKARLQAEGLFEQARKRELPRFPRKIGIVTSPSGAALRDMLRVIGRRFGELHIVIAPCRVQGDGAAEEIARGLGDLNALGDVDVIIVGRGGGSLEDLWAFNEETVARAIVASKAPVISAVGHEVDFTIADFVADLRAPTPSAAAELVVREKQAVVDALEELRRRLCRAAVERPNSVLLVLPCGLNRLTRLSTLKASALSVKLLPPSLKFLASRRSRSGVIRRASSAMPVGDGSVTRRHRVLAVRRNAGRWSGESETPWVSVIASRLSRSQCGSTKSSVTLSRSASAVRGRG